MSGADRIADESGSTAAGIPADWLADFEAAARRPLAQRLR
jgi:hypothetical protein